MSLQTRVRPEVRARVVYVGPGLGGKTTNLERIAAHLIGGRLSGVSTREERTLFFDFLPIGFELASGGLLRVSLQTVPGQIRYRDARKMVLRNVDALVFVADSQRMRLDANRFALDDIQRILVELGRDPATLPIAFQYNKRDLADAVPLKELQGVLNPAGAPAVASVATSGIGVFRTLGIAVDLARAELSARRQRVLSPDAG